MRNIVRICSIISLIIASVKIGMIGHLTPGMVVFIIICGLLFILGNRTVFIIASGIAALVIFVKIYGGSSTGESALLQGILTLVIICFALYIMLKGFFNPLKSRRK